MLLSTSKGIVIVNIDHVVRIDAISNYSKLFFADGKTLVVAKLLRWFEERLPSAQFTRVHRGHIVNREYLRSYTHSGNGCLQLVNGDLIGIARRKKKTVLQWLYAQAAW